VDGDEAAVDPGRQVVRLENAFSVPEPGVIEPELGFGGDQVRCHANVGFASPWCSGPSPHITEHPPVEGPHESVVKDAFWPARLCLPSRPWQGGGDVLELDLVQVSAGCDEVRDEAIKVFL
jgi:hypothetical protein